MKDSKFGNIQNI